LGNFVTGELPPPDSTAVVNHLRQCERCSSRVRDLESAAATDPLLADLNRPSTPTPVDPEYRAALERLIAAPPVGPPLPGVGEVLDDYRLVEVIGEGGMGVVYRAVHTRLDREVALKVIRRSRALDAQAALRFGREMKAAGKVRHPNLVQATDAGVANGVEYLVMEYVAGTDLARLVLRDGPLPLPRACDYVRQAAVGLQHAHDNGLIHRDVKPSNLMLGRDGTIRVLDLGLALVPGEELAVELPPHHPAVFDTVRSADDTLTSPGQQLGTRDYTAPEQLRDSHRVDHRADVYGLGCTLVYLLTGRRYDSREGAPPVFPAEFWAQFLSVDPQHRFPTAEDAARALAPYCEHSRQHRRGFLVAAGAGVLAAVGLGASLLTRNRSPHEVAVAPPPRLVPPRGKLPMTGEEVRALQKQWADHLGQTVSFKNSLGMELALIPPGEFAMSSVYLVTITRPYWVGTTEVTFAQYDEFTRATGYITDAEQPRVSKVGARFRTWKPLATFPFPQDPVHRLSPGWGGYASDQPIGYVTWRDIDEFLKWLSRREDRTYRLPTQAEWVWACRAGTVSRVYWGENYSSGEENAYAWTRSAGADRPRPVGKLLPNAWGLYDMLGNVEELVHDYVAVDYVPGGHAVDPVGPPPTDTRTTCGGSYYEQLRRTMFQTGISSNNVVYSNQGFRVVMEA
jgi:serine/threonine protein kinase